MDVIIEGKITPEEGVDEVLRTCAEIKSVKNPILRINDNNSELQGRIAFSQGGYIIGGLISGSSETGYSAVRKLLMISDGNYAILDPLRRHIADVNQSLWIKIDRLVPMLPNLPEDPEGLVDRAPEVGASPVKNNQVDISGKMAAVADSGAIDKIAPVTVDPQSKMRGKNVGFLRVLRSGIFIIMGFSAVFGSVLYRNQIIDFFKHLFGNP